jgi:CRP/FNR family transcriptional regulator, transcriptional activator FtrB
MVRLSVKAFVPRAIQPDGFGQAMRAQDAELVRDQPLFKNSAQESFDALVAAGYLQRFPAGVTLLYEGEYPDFLHILIEGQIEFFSQHGDTEATLSVLKPPATFILAAVITDGPYLKSAKTLLPSTAVLIPASDVRAVFEKDTVFARAVVTELACRYRTITKDLKNHRLRTALVRLANWILQQDAESGGSGRFELPYEKRVLAAQLGMRPEALSRSFADLADVGAVIRGTEVQIRDRQRLVAFANPSPLIDEPEHCLGF